MGKVCQTTYKAPDNLEEVVAYLNKYCDGGVCVMYKDGRVIGKWPYPNLPVQGDPSDFIWVATGDQNMFQADTVAEATAFLQGILIAVENWIGHIRVEGSA